MQLTVNGRSENLDSVATVRDLLEHFDVAPVRAAVELNRDLVPRSQYGHTPLSGGDVVEIVTFVGGG